MGGLAPEFVQASLSIDRPPGRFGYRQRVVQQVGGGLSLNDAPAVDDILSKRPPEPGDSACVEPDVMGLLIIAGVIAAANNNMLATAKMASTMAGNGCAVSSLCEWILLITLG